MSENIPDHIQSQPPAKVADEIQSHPPMHFDDEPVLPDYDFRKPSFFGQMDSLLRRWGVEPTVAMLLIFLTFVGYRLFYPPMYKDELAFPLFFAGIAFGSVVLRTACYLSSTPIPPFPAAALISVFTFTICTASRFALVMVFSDPKMPPKSLFADLLSIPIGFAVSSSVIVWQFKVSYAKALLIALYCLLVALVSSVGIACVVLFLQFFNLTPPSG